MQTQYVHMNKRILRLAVPNIISNITIPLLGMVDVAIAGRLGEDAAIGALAVGSSIFNMIYWACSFIRMGTSGLTAQAFGAKNDREISGLLVRSLVVALTLGLLLVVFQKPIGRIALGMMDGSERVMELAADYFYARIWAAPASVGLFALHGWFIGMQDSKTPMYASVFSNILNVVFSVLFVFRYDMGVAGIAWGTVVAQYGSVLLSVVFWVVRYRCFARFVRLRESMRIKQLLRFFNVNKDIFLRSVCNVTAYTFFTVASSRFDDTTLATNALLMQLFTLYSYMSDGFAYAAESLVGRYVGARDEPSLKEAIRKLFWWSAGISVLYVLVYVVGWEWILSLFSSSEAILETARHYIGWVILVPLLGCVPFLIDGIMLGATQTKVLRNTIFVAMVAYFGVYYSLVGVMGNNALWLAFIVYILARGILLYFATGKLDTGRLMKGYS